VNTEALPDQQVYSWWGVVYPEFSKGSTEEQRSEDTQYVLKLRSVELWKQLKQWMKSGV